MHLVTSLFLKRVGHLGATLQMSDCVDLIAPDQAWARKGALGARADHLAESSRRKTTVTRVRPKPGNWRLALRLLPSRITRPS